MAIAYSEREREFTSSNNLYLCTLQTITTRHSNRKQTDTQTTDGTAIADAYSEREGCQSTRHNRELPGVSTRHALCKVKRSTRHM